MIFALLLVKAPAQAKHRLRAVFSPEEREQLARIMFEEVLGVLVAARGSGRQPASRVTIDRVVVAASDAEILRGAAAAGAWTLVEATQNGHSSSADWAARRCMEWGATMLLMVPTDVPLVTAVEIERLLETAQTLPAPSLVIVPSADGTGTNALVRTPPDVIESRFGPDSFAAHLAQARAKQARVEVVRPTGLVFDLDTPDDLAQFLARGPGGATAEFLRRIGAAARLLVPPDANECPKPNP